MKGEQMVHYKEGRKYIDGVVVEGITVVGDDEPVEMIIQPIHPEPFVYGVKRIVTDVLTDAEGNETCTIYDVKTGKYLTGEPFKGWDWLNSIPNLVNTLDAEEDLSYLEELALLKQRTLANKKDVS